MSIAIDRERVSEGKKSSAMYRIEIEQASKDLRIAHQRLDNASGPFVDSAIHLVNACQSRLDALLREYKQEFGTDGPDAA